MAKNTENTAETPLETAVVFRDKAYKSRTIVLSDGRSFAVEKSRIASNDAALIACLDQHPEFERQSATE